MGLEDKQLFLVDIPRPFAMLWFPGSGRRLEMIGQGLLWIQCLVRIHVEREAVKFLSLVNKTWP
jgi:hypothetical protein